MRRIYPSITLVILVVLTATTGLAAAKGSSSSGDAPDVLVVGNPPLTRTMAGQIADLLGWALDGSFTPDQTEEFAQLLVVEWRRGDQATIKNYVAFSQLPALLASATEEQKETVHDRLQAELLRIIDNNPSDETASLLLSVYNAGHRPTARQGGAPPGNTARPGDTPRQGGVPGALVGKWEYTTTSSVMFGNGAGSYSAPSGFGYSYEISADGRYIYSGLLQSSLYSCTTRVFKYKTGVASVEGSTITFNPSSYEQKSEDNCRREWNYVKHPTPEKEVFQWRIERESRTDKLCLFKPDGQRFGCLTRK